MPIRKRYQFAEVEGARVGRLNLGINTTFIVYRLGDTLVDCGPSNQWPDVKRFIQEKPVNTLLLSHHHEDHSGNAARIADLCKLVPYAPQQAANKFSDGYRTPVLQKIIWGSPQPVQTQLLPDVITLSDQTRLETIFTPGHAKDLHCFYLPEKGWLFSGDLYISKSIRFLRADEHLDQIITSTRKVLERDFDTLFCPHRGILEDGKQALSEKLENIVQLCENAQQLQQKGYGLKQIVKQLLGPEEVASYLSGFNFAKVNLIAQALELDSKLLKNSHR